MGAVEHQMVHCGEMLTVTSLIIKGVKDKVKSLFNLTPLHNPTNYVWY
ncbi:MAG: hypothetical protein ABI045_02270 [Flavobacteriales bacterium]